MCSCRADGNVFLVGQNQALGPGSLGTSPEPCFQRQGASVLRSASPPFDVLSVRQRVGGICPRKAGRGAEGPAAQRADVAGLLAAYVSRVGSCIWAGGKEKKEQMRSRWKSQTVSRLCS